MDNFNLDISVISLIVTIIAALATIITVVLSYRSIKKENIDAILKEAKERARLDALTEKSIEKHTECIVNNTNDIKNNANDIKKNTSDIKSNANDIKSNTNDIIRNANDIKSNTNDIRNNINDIRRNINDIRRNANDIKSNTNDIRNNINDIRRNTNDIRNNANDICDLKSCIKTIKSDLEYIKGSLDITKCIKNSNKTLFESHSPISLTEQGKKVFEELQQSGILTRNIERIIKNIDAQELKTAYDIQEYCIETSSVEPEAFFDEEGINFVKSYAYNNGTSVQLYLRLLGIVIRDEYFKRRNIDVNLVDEH